MFIYAVLDKNNICMGFEYRERKTFSANKVLVDQSDCSFIDKKYDFETNTWTGKNQNEKNEENQLILMEAIATQYEEHIENRINDMEVQASIYEAVLALGGE